MFSVCGVHHTLEFECNKIAGCLLSMRVFLYAEDCQSVQNVSKGIFILVFITESPSGVCRLATRHSVCGV